MSSHSKARGNPNVNKDLSQASVGAEGKLKRKKGEVNLIYHILFAFVMGSSCVIITLKIEIYCFCNWIKIELRLK